MKGMELAVPELKAEKKFESRGGVDRLSVRLTLHLTARERTGKKELRREWDQLEDASDEVQAVLELIERMAGGK